MKPIIKWVGGKGSNLSYIRDRLPKKFNTYYEPFLGGAAVLLDLAPKVATVSDINFELINMYEQIKSNPSKVFEYTYGLDSQHESSETKVEAKAFYYSVREAFNNNLNCATAEQAARFLYLNKHCFNGLYRVNSKGLFNVPFNNKLYGASCTKEQLYELSFLIKDYTFLVADFDETLNIATKDDFVFLDSPYAPLTPTSFTDYTKEGFDYNDHVRLAKCFKKLDEIGVYCMLTNHNTELIRELYRDYNIVEVDVRRSINRNGSNRKGKEVIITNY